jgi:hypothetical protein
MIMGMMIIPGSTVNALPSSLLLKGVSNNKAEASITWQIDTENYILSEEDSIIYYNLLVYGDQASDIVGLDNMQVKTGWTDLGLDWDYTKSLISGTLIKNLNQKAGDNYEDNDFYYKSIYTIFNSKKEAIADLIVVKLKSNYEYNDTIYVNFDTIITNPDIYASNETTKMINNVTVIDYGFDSDIVSNYSASYQYISSMFSADLIERDYSIDPDTYSVSGTNVVDNAFDYVEKTAVVKIIVNPNGINFDEDGKNLDNKEISSVLADGWSFTDIDEDNEFIMYEAALSETDGLYITNLVDNPSSILTADFSVDGKVTFDFSSLNKAYVIFVKTKISDDTFYKYLTDDDSLTRTSDFNFTLSGLTVDVDDSISNDMSLSLLEAGQTEVTSDGLYNWYLDFKPYGLEHENIEIEHYLPDNNEFLLNSNADIDTTKGVFTYTELILNSDGTYTEGDSFDIVNDLNIYYLPNLFSKIMVFELPDTSLGYKIRYSSLITRVYTQEPTVYYHITDDLKSYLNKTETDYVDENFHDLEYKIEVPPVTEQQVTDADNTGGCVNVSSTDVRVNSSFFGIFSKDGSRLVRMFTTNNNGDERFSGLAEGTYLIREIMADEHAISSKIFNVTVSLNNGLYTTSVDGKTGQGSSDVILDEPFKETELASINFFKNIFNKYVENDKEFKYTVYANGVNGNYEYKGFTGKEDGILNFVDGVAEFTLKKFEIIVLTLPVGISYEIVPEADVDGYKTFYTVISDGDEGNTTRINNYFLGDIVRQTRTDDFEETSTTSTTTNSSEVVVVASVNETEKAIEQPVKKVVKEKIDEEEQGDNVKEDQPEENNESNTDNQMEQEEKNVAEPETVESTTPFPTIGFVVGIPLLILLISLIFRKMMAKKI